MSTIEVEIFTIDHTLYVLLPPVGDKISALLSGVLIIRVCINEVQLYKALRHQGIR